jgi:DNA-directed RNA polymerase subunit RPC12/RpoP
MPVFTYKCPACGGALKYDPNSGKFSCEFCDSVYEEKYLASLDDKAFDNLKRADRAGEFGKAEEGAQLVYSCPSCGAEIVTDETTAATMCYYCHNPVVLTGRLAADMRPDALLPFKYDKKEARDKFFSWIRKKKYVPREFISEENVENISGVYYPYWLADYQTGANFTGEGRIVTNTSTPMYNITTTKHYSVTRDADVSFRNIERGALKKADRKLSDGVHPYLTDELINFEPSYLSGFMAEKRDVESDDVRGSVEEEIKSYIQPLLTANSPYTSISGSSSVEYKQNSFRYTLLPAWVLTYKGRNEKMYYYAMNGQTGEVCGVLPVNMKKLLLHCGIIAALVCAAVSTLCYFIN